MPRRADVPCADCGQMMWRGTGSLPPGVARCRPCRKARPVAQSQRRQPRRSSCSDCGLPSWGVRCRSCNDIAQRIRPIDDSRVTRHLRELAAPGLNQSARKRLLAQWKRQAKACAYCDALATSIDHVVPLVRGGTNHEGNLVPCCRQCNSSKAARLLVEWRHGKQAAPMPALPDWAIPDRRIRKPKVTTWQEVPMFNICAGCAAPVTGRAKWCSNRCNMRVTYRRQHGIPDMAALYSSRKVA